MRLLIYKGKVNDILSNNYLSRAKTSVAYSFGKGIGQGLKRKARSDPDSYRESEDL